MPINDIREYKASLRKKVRAKRESLPAEIKEELDKGILGNITRLRQYKLNETILTYVSTRIEVDTIALIRRALRDNKRVAVPRCVENSREMEFYYINSLDELEPRTFGVLEPVKEKCELLTDYTKGLCIVPGLAFDFQGYRLGYGKGFYDRFLGRFSGDTAGICYSSCVVWKLHHSYYDKNAKLLVTEKYIRRTDKNTEVSKNERRYERKTQGKSRKF